MTQERIWRLDEEGDPTPLTAADYDDEADLQKLIADHPEVLERVTPDEPRRWLLVSREMGIPDSEESGDRWAVDHLLLDQDARPTLVEVKRGDNSEIRRRVVGQMLDYAAHATRYWTADTVRERLEAEAEGEDSARQRIAKLLDDEGELTADAYEEFWERVDRNLSDENVRLLFAADRIPSDLGHIVEFLNRHMGPRVEVLAVELRQFRGQGARTLVPRVIGGSDGPRSRTSSTRRVLTMETFLPELPDPEVREAARALLERSERAGATLGWGGASVSIRVRCPAWHQLVSVAWLSPEGKRTGMGTRNFSFGSFMFEDYDRSPPPSLPETMLQYVQQFEPDPWARHSPASDTVWEVAPRDVPAHVDTIAGRVEAVLRELAVLLPAE